MKKVIKIFLGSSIKEFEREREAIDLFIRRISDSFEDNYGVRIRPLLCENFDEAYSEIRKQEEYNGKVRESDLCFFIFFTKAGQYTREEFGVARQRFLETGKPKIYTYFKVLGDETAEESLTEFMDELDKVFAHYYGTFEHIDTVKLRILLNLKLQELDFVEIKIEGNECLVDGRAVLSVENVAEFVNNGILVERKAELEFVNVRYFALKDKFADGKCSASENRQYFDLASRRQQLIDEIEQLQKDIFNMSLRMCRDEIEGDMSDRHKKAYHLFVTGDLEGTINALPPEEIDRDYRNRNAVLDAAMDEIIEAKKRNARVYVREYRTRIDALTMKIDYPDRFREIEEIYDKITAEALEYGVELDTVLDFIGFLYLQNKKKAYEIIEKVEETYLQYADQFDAFTLFNAYYIFGTVYGAVASKRNEAEKNILKSMEIGEKLAEEKPDSFNSALVDIYNNVAYFYVSHGNPTEGERYFLKAVKICENLLQENTGRVKFSLAVCYNNFGDFYEKQGEAQKAEFCFVKAKDIFEELVAEEPERVNYYLAGVYNNIGLLYSNIPSKRKETEENYLKAKDIYEKLAKTNPERFGSALANLYNNIALFCMECGDAENAGKYHMEAVRIRKKLADENPERFSVDLSQSYCSIAMFYCNQGNNEDAKKYFHNAIAIMEKLVELDPDSFNAHLANIYNLIGFFYFNQRQPAEAKKYLEKAVELREKLADANPEGFNAELAVSYNNIGAFYLSQQEYEEAEKYFGKAIEIYEKLAEKYPEIYNEALAGIYGNTGLFYEKRHPEKAKEYYLKALYIKEKLAREDPQRFNPDLAICCFNLALFLDNSSYFEKALKLAMTRPDHPQCRQIIECFEREKKNIIDAAEKEAAVDCIADEKRRREECEAAEECYRKEPNYENRDKLAYAYYMLGLLLVIKDKGNVLSEAEVFFNKSLALRKENYNEDRCYENRAELGILLEWLGDIAIGKNTDEATLAAEDYYIKAFELFKENYCEIQNSESREALKKVCSRLLNINKNKNTTAGKIAAAKLAKLIEDLSADE